MNLKEAYEYAKQNKIETNQTRILLKYILKDKFNLYLAETLLSIEEETYFKNYINQLKGGKPIQYITHEQYFYGEKFYVDANVLIPQPDTEIIVNEAIKQIQNIKKKNVKILDLCTGSGAIAISILKCENEQRKKQHNVQMYASDISKEAINIAYKNEENILKEHTIKFIQSDMFENIDKKFDIIVSNPPYIRKDVIKTLPIDVQKEPHIALDGGNDGLKYYRIIEKNYKEYLNDKGIILLEIGYDQKEEVQELFKNSICIKDFAGNDRVIMLQLQ